MKKKEYDVCSGLTIEELNREVMDALEEGWECVGGVAVTPYPDSENKDLAFEGLIFHQAIYREIDENQYAKNELAKILKVSSEELS